VRRDRQPGERRKGSNALNTDEVDGRTGDKGGNQGLRMWLNMSEEGRVTRVGSYEVVQVMSMITYITIIYVM